MRRATGWALDASPRGPGRGAYLCSRACAVRSLKNKRYPGLGLAARAAPLPDAAQAAPLPDAAQVAPPSGAAQAVSPSGAAQAVSPSDAAQVAPRPGLSRANARTRAAGLCDSEVAVYDG